MDKNKKEEYFKRQLPQLKGTAYKLSKKFKMDYSEIEGKVFEKFCEVIDKYDESKSSIWTFLNHQLLNLNNELKGIIRRKKGFRNVNIDVLQYTNFEEYKCKFIEIIDFYDSYNTQLSERAKIVLEYILDAPIGGINRIPSYSSVSKYFVKILGWKTDIFKNVWEEIKVWWINSDFVYC